MYARQLAYLHAVPKSSLSATATGRRSRLQEYIDSEQPVPVPPIPPGGHALLSRFLDVGPMSTSGVGAAPLSYVELRAYESVSGVRLLPWEGQLLRQLSIEYVAQLNKSERPDTPAPWAAPVAMDREAVARNVHSIFGARAATTARPGKGIR